jgi:hypothetical protein
MYLFKTEKIASQLSSSCEWQSTAARSVDGDDDAL